MNFFRTKKQKGLTLIEFILVFGVFSLLTLGVYNLAANVTASTTAITEAEKLDTVIEKIERVVSITGTFENINIDVFNEITDGYASNLNLVSVSGDNEKFSLFYENVPDKACTKFSENVLVKNENISVKINDSTLAPYSSIALISEACKPDNKITVMIGNTNTVKLANMSTVIPVSGMAPNSAPTFNVKGFVPSKVGTMTMIRSLSLESRDSSGVSF